MPRTSPRADPRGGVVELDVRNNSLNLIRLVLAAMVLFAHSFPLGGLGTGPMVKGNSFGTWAVFGFFAISGYLITASRFANPLGNYLVKRIVRIFPAFLVCNLVTAFVIAPFAWWAKGGSLREIFTAPHSPANYVYSNVLLRMNFYDIGSTPAHVPYARAWNGSLWSLYYEFWCYLIIGAIAGFALLRRPAAIAVTFVLSVVVWAKIAAVLPYVNGNHQLWQLLQLLPAFLGGAVVMTVAKRLIYSWFWALAAGAGAVLMVAVIDDWGAQAAAPLITYVILWASMVIRSPRLIQRHDISYGFYIYAFPVQQLLATFGVHRAGLVVFIPLALVGTAILATASWLLVESPMLNLAKRSRGLARVPARPVDRSAPPPGPPTGSAERPAADPDAGLEGAGEVRPVVG